MSIRTKIIIVVVTLFALSASVDFIVQRFIIYPSFMKLEQHEAGENIRRIVGAINREIFHLDKLCSDWAMWNDSYDFVETLSDDYIQANLIIDAYLTNKVNLITYFRNDGSVAWGQAYDLEVESGFSLSFLKNGSLPLTHPMLELKPSPIGDLSHFRNGVIMTRKGPMLFASRSILRSDGTGPSRGVLTMGRLITDDGVGALADQTRIPFTIDYPLTPEDIRQTIAGRMGFHKQALTYYAQKEKQHINVWTVYNNPQGKAVFSIAYQFPREITKKGMASIRYALLFGVGATLTTLAILIIFLQSAVVHPIQRLTEHASRLDNEGGYTAQLHLNRRDELGQLARVLNFTAATIAERTNSLKTANLRLEKLSRLDGLTGIANRRLFDDHLENEWRRAVRRNGELSLIILDVDYFKNYNDRYGHQKGDQCLVAIAAAIANQVTRPADLAARYGGEEFAVILPDTDDNGAFQVAEKIRQAICNLNILHDDSAAANIVTLSLGVSSVRPSAADDLKTFIQQTDQALYQAKKTGRNKAVRAE